MLMNSKKALDLLNTLLNVFEDTNAISELARGAKKCTRQNEGCHSRIISALTYYETNGRDKFIEYCYSQYSSNIVDDYINFITDDTMQYTENMDNFECKNTENGQCPYVRQHFKNKSSYDSDHCSNFFTELFDSIHFNLRHRKSMKMDDGNDETEEKYNRDHHRLNKLKEDTSRFNLIVTTIQQQKGIFHAQFIWFIIRIVSAENEENEMLGNKVFYYWSHYKQTKPELYVPTQYESIKEEALFSGFVSVEDWDALVVEKAQQFIKSTKCKQMHCIEKYDELHYNIPHKAPITMQHLQSIILWCDFVDFSFDFRSTFRSITWNESLSSIKERNQKYHHMAKYLNEAVTYFGINGETQSGPFYCGMNMVLQVPSFAATLNGPISTSKNLGIISRLCESKGMIFEFDNRSSPGIFETFFDCKWLSSFPEECECLFVRGRCKLDIVSIRIKSKHSNQWTVHENRAYSLFNQMVSGEWSSDQKVNDSDVSLLRDSIDYALKKLDKSKVENNQYLYTNFRLFCLQKKKIVLNLCDMDKSIDNQEFVGLLMHSVAQINPNKLIRNDKTNICKAELFSIFPNMTELIIYSSSLYYVYAFDILCLLSMIRTHSKLLKKIIIRDLAKDEYKWLYLSALEAKSNDEGNGYNFAMKREESEDSLIVSV